MKKIFYLFLLPILLVGCSKETEKLSEPSPVGGMISVHSQREFSDGPLSASAIHSAPVLPAMRSWLTLSKRGHGMQTHAAYCIKQ